MKYEIEAEDNLSSYFDGNEYNLESVIMSCYDFISNLVNNTNSDLRSEIMVHLNAIVYVSTNYILLTNHLIEESENNIVMMEDENNISTRTVVKDFICEICYYLRKKGTELVLNSLSKHINECINYIGENNNNSMTSIGWKTLEAVIFVFGNLIEYIHFSIYIF